MHVQVAQAPGAQAPGKTETVSDPSNRNNYFVRHWRGEISLPISFWLNGICGIFVFGLLVKIITVGVRHAGPDPIIIAVAIPRSSSPALLSAYGRVWVFGDRRPITSCGLDANSGRGPQS